MYMNALIADIIILKRFAYTTQMNSILTDETEFDQSTEERYQTQDQIAHISRRVKINGCIAEYKFGRRKTTLNKLDN